MTIQEAKMILCAYRPNGQEAQDPKMREALELAKVDPELGRWFAEQQEFDRCICNKLDCCGVPQDLKSTILTGRTIIQSQAFWKRPVAWAAAACLLLLLASSVQLMRPTQPTLAEYRDEIGQRAAGMIREGIDLDFHSAKEEDVLKWLDDRKMANSMQISSSMSRGNVFGCKNLDWRGHRVAMICFKGPHNQVAHLFIIERKFLSGIPDREVKEICSVDSFPTLTWFDDSNAYVLVGHTPDVRVQEFL